MRQWGAVLAVVWSLWGQDERPLLKRYFFLRRTRARLAGRFHLGIARRRYSSNSGTVNSVSPWAGL